MHHLCSTQALPPTDVLQLPHSWFQRHYPELFTPPATSPRDPPAPPPAERLLSVVVHGVGQALQHLVTNVVLSQEAGSDTLSINDARVKIAIRRCMLPNNSLWMTSLLCSGPGVLDVEVACVAAANPEAKPDSTAGV